jgi:hypothetical protein
VVTREEDVLGLDVAMDDALLVSMAECAAHLEGVLDCILDGEHPLAVNAIAERLALHEGHYIVEQSVGGAGVVEAEDVRMLELGSEFDFALKAIGTDGRGEVRVEDLDGDIAVVLKVLGQEDCGHAAAAELAFDGVPVAEGAAECADRVGAFVRRSRRRRGLRAHGAELFGEVQAATATEDGFGIEGGPAVRAGGQGVFL